MEPPPDIAGLIAAVVEAQERVKTLERETRSARDELAQRVREAADAEISLALIGRAIGVSRQRVADIYSRGR